MGSPISHCPKGGIVPGTNPADNARVGQPENRTIKKTGGSPRLAGSMELETTPRAGPRTKAKSLEDQGQDQVNTSSHEALFLEATADANARTRPAKGFTAPAQAVVPAWEAMLPYVPARFRSCAMPTRCARSVPELRGLQQTNLLVFGGGRDSWLLRVFYPPTQLR